MKKLFIAFSLLAALSLAAVPAQALMGMPDDVPGCDVLAPFFLVSKAGHGNINTLFTFTEVTTWLPMDFHYNVLTQRSVTVYNAMLKGTPGDIVSIDAATILAAMAPSAKAQLEIDLDGDGVKDHYAGYIFFENYTYANNVVSSVYLLNLLAGMASSANLPAKEMNLDLPLPYDAVMTDRWGVELFSANALAAAEQLQVGGTHYAPFQGAIGFGLTPRYYIVDANAYTYFFIWKSVNGLGPGLNDLHINFWNADEKFVSSNLPLPNELNIIDIEPYLPVILHGGVYPKEGWVDIMVPDLHRGPSAAVFGDWEWLGYTWQMATGSAAESWTVLNPIPRWVWWRDKPWWD